MVSFLSFRDFGGGWNDEESTQIVYGAKKKRKNTKLVCNFYEQVYNAAKKLLNKHKA